MKTKALLLVLACTFVMMASSAAEACAVTIDGTGYLDTDCDGVRDADDNCLTQANGFDCDADELNCDVNDDGDVTEDELLAGDQVDLDDDGVGDACDNSDGDSLEDYRDNCPTETNEGQDPIACTDSDYDGVMDPDDNCTGTINPSQQNRDTDSIGDACDICPFTANEDQDPNACPPSRRGPIADPQATTPVTRPSPSETGGSLPQHVEGSGGCSLAANVAATPWALLSVAAAGVLAAVRARRRS